MASQYGSNDGAEASRNRSTISRSSETPTQQDDAEMKKARKREQDRLCQRRKREKDRENLRRLEARLNGLQNPDEPKVVLDLILRHEQDQERLNRQAERLRQIESLIRTSLSDIGNELTSSSTPNDSVVDAKADVKETTSLPTAGIPTTTEVPMYTSVQGAPMPTATATSMVMPVNNPALLASQYPMTIPLNMPPQSQPPMPPSSPPNHQISTITDAMSAVPGMAAAYTDEAFDQHIIVMVLIHGWDAVAAYMQLDPLWSLLRQIDGGACSQWRKVDRMVGMLSFRRMMKGMAMGPQAMATIEPKFMRPRPSQLHVPHIPNGDYFPWPGVRERFVFEGPKYDNDTFLNLFNSSTRFMWNSDFSTAFVQNDKQLFQFSDELVKRFYNLSCWRIDAAFIAAYPEFAGDIPTYNSVPKKIDDKPYDGEYFFGSDLDDGVTHNGPGAATSAGGQWMYDHGRWYLAGAVR
ncbi:hypothetical protein E4T48_07847 [Aureobasidium sp. EXF-10727]|nr:hypothetical protein E4T48_07847 [Aureobasidium sp. EXF-10727]KAI4728311.1 hypothetical protein E4T49_03914 [Aureobasidium sp. EXF-10728]